MLNHKHTWCVLVLLMTCLHGVSLAATTTTPKLVVISEDIIPDVENTTQKVIRVNPLDLPAIPHTSNDTTDSSLYKIQSLIPATRRNYVNSNRMRRPQPIAADKTTDSPIVIDLQLPKILKPKHQHKKKHPHFLYNQADYDGNLLAKQMNVRVAPGAYPVYYTVAKTNGKFGKFPIKSFRNMAEFHKYLVKSKQEPITMSERYEYES